MPKATFRQTNFKSGKSSRLIEARSDLSRRYESLSECVNFIVKKQGPLCRRPGLRYVAASKNDSGDVSLIPFQFSAMQSYQLEFGDRYVRFFRDRDQIMDDGSLRSDGSSSTPFELSTSYQESDESVFTIDSGGSVSPTSTASLPVNSFAWGNSQSSGAIPDGIARIGLTTSGASSGLVVGMNVEVVGITMADGADARRVNGTRRVVAVDTGGNNVDVLVPMPVAASVSTTSAKVEMPDYSLVTSSDLVSGHSIGPNDVVNIDSASESGVSSRTEYTGRFRTFGSNQSAGSFYYAMSPSGGTCDKISFRFIDRGVSKLDYAQSEDVLFLRHENERPKELQRVQGWLVTDVAYSSMNSGTATITISTSASPHPFQATSPSDGIYSKVVVSGCSPSSYNGCFEITAVSDNSISYTIGVSDPGVLTEFGQADGWQIVNSPDRNGPYEDIKSVDTSSDPSMSVTLGSGSGGLSSQNDLLKVEDSVAILSSDVGRHIATKDTSVSDWGNGTITWIKSSSSSPASVQFYVSRDELNPFTAPAPPDAQNSWMISKWGDVNGWPRTVSFLDSRIASGGSRAYESGFWASTTGDLNDHRPFNPESPYDVSASDAIDKTISDGRANAIYWMVNSSLGMVVGTDSGEYLFKNSSTSEPLSNETIINRNQSNIGSKKYVKPARASNSEILFVEKSGRRIYEIAFNPDSFDALASRDLTILSDELFDSEVNGISFTGQPDSICWCSSENGKLFGLTYDRSNEVIGWHQHEIGGVAPDGEDRPIVKSISSIPDDSTDNKLDQLWLVVERKINGSTKRYIEFMEDLYDIDDTVSDSFFVDSGITYDGVETTTITGLSHLEGETVGVLGDGVQQSDQVVSGGQISISSASKVQVGLRYSSSMSTQGIKLAQDQPESSDKIMRLESAVVDFMDANGCKIGLSESDLHEIDFPSNSSLHTGIIDDMGLDSGYERSQKLWIVNDSLFPTTVRALSVELEYREVQS